MTEQIVDIVEANMPVSSDVEAAAKGAGAAAGEYAGRQAANASLADVRALADTNKSRLDTLTAAPASGNTELVDVRVGCDGKTYPTAGDAVRAQIGSCVRERGLIRGSNPEPPYDDLDTLPNESIVTYTDFQNVAHKPGGYPKGGTVLTYTGASSSPGGTIQMVVSRDARIAIRTKWNNPATWSAWSHINANDIIKPADIIVNISNTTPPYDDLDTLPNASIVTYARFPNVAHAPADVTGGPWSPIPGHLQEIPAPCRSSYHRMAIWRTVSNGSTLRYGRIGRCSARRTDTIRPLHTPVSPPTDASA